MNTKPETRSFICKSCGNPPGLCDCSAAEIDRKETRGRKPLPAEKRRVQRTVSLDFDDNVQLVRLAK